MKKEDSKSIEASDRGLLDGSETIIDDWLKCPQHGKPPHYRHKKSWQDLASGSLGKLDGLKLLTDWHERMEQNWAAIQAAGRYETGQSNWALRTAGEIRGDNPSAEKILEKRIANLNPQGAWFNQMPTASGVAGSSSFRKGSIDLVKRIHCNEYEFIELKVTSNTPLFAAMEIIGYGLLYVVSRRNMAQLRYANSPNNCLGAVAVHLCVLAPWSFYERFGAIEWMERLENSLNDGVARFAKLKLPHLQMSFRFDSFSKDFQWESESFREKCDGEILTTALSNVISVGTTCSRKG